MRSRHQFATNLPTNPGKGNLKPVSRVIARARARPPRTVSVHPHPRTTATTHQISPDLQPTCGRTPPRAEAKSLAASISVSLSEVHHACSPLPQPFLFPPRASNSTGRSPTTRSRRAALCLPPQFSPSVRSQRLLDGLYYSVSRTLFYIGRSAF